MFLRRSHCRCCLVQIFYLSFLNIVGKTVFFLQYWRSGLKKSWDLGTQRHLPHKAPRPLDSPILHGQKLARTSTLQTLADSFSFIITHNFVFNVITHNYVKSDTLLLLLLQCGRSGPRKSRLLTHPAIFVSKRFELRTVQFPRPELDANVDLLHLFAAVRTFRSRKVVGSHTRRHLHRKALRTSNGPRSEARDKDPGQAAGRGPTASECPIRDFIGRLDVQSGGGGSRRLQTAA